MSSSTSLANGRSYLAIPGPSVIPDAVLQAMHRPAPNIYEGGLVAMTETLFPDLKRVARTRHHVAIYVGNGHAAWEAALANTVAPGAKVLALATGRFAYGWANMAEGVGAVPQILDFGRRNAVDLNRFAEALQADTRHGIKAVLVAHVDTSTSVLNDIAALRGVLDDVRHPALLMVDCIASLGCDRFEMDAWGVDVVVTGSQKGLMVPPGISFVFFNDKADMVRQTLPRVSRYWDWAPRIRPEAYYNYFSGTAPTHHLYGLRAALDMIHDEGIEAIWARHDRLARAIWAAVNVWGQDGPLQLNVMNPDIRSRAVTCLRIGAPHGANLRRYTASQLGLTLGLGIGMESGDDPNCDGYFRFGHMGHVSGQMILGLLGGVQAGLIALDIPHGKGAVEAAALVITGG
ncbi:MAG: aminotransferase class V-fold PLP-dependent enzyme [Rhodobacteraceae bacterium]|nr:aminotransferase class V-fold PLP-dependent enzyme [Paracoccaceae bacterium]